MSLKRKRPIIGLTVDSQDGAPGTYSKLRWYGLRENYAESITQFGGVPVMVPQQLDLVGDYLDLLDGILFVGGKSDIEPWRYGDTSMHPETTIDEKRTAFELALLHQALDKGTPVLGICRGMQLMSVYAGGCLIQHVPDECQSVNHAPESASLIAHQVSIMPDTKLHKIIGQDKISVNSSHHQAARSIGECCVLNAKADDGIIEGIEVKDHPFAISVQWHPEFIVTDHDAKLLKAFIDAAHG